MIERKKYLLSILFVFQKDLKNIYVLFEEMKLIVISNIIIIIKFFLLLGIKEKNY